MTKRAKRLEELFIDITFAEDREFDSVKRAFKIIGQKIEVTFAATALAEAGEFEAAVSYLDEVGEVAQSPRAGCTIGRCNRLCTGRPS
jgi:hypothetical protein